MKMIVVPSHPAAADSLRTKVPISSEFRFALGVFTGIGSVVQVEAVITERLRVPTHVAVGDRRPD